MSNNLLKQFLVDESGQGITEYGAILAFIAVLVGLVLSLLNGVLKTAISSAFSMVASELSNLVANASS